MESPNSGNIRLLQEFDTKLFADSVEWCPLEGSRELLLCGTYQLDEGQAEQNPEAAAFQVRVGKLYLLKLTNCRECPQLFQQLCIETPGILDIKWGQTVEDGHPVFALVNAAGEVTVNKVSDHGCSVSKISAVDLGVECLGLSLDWSNRVNSGADPQIVCSDSTGHVTTCCLRPSGLQRLARWPAHDYEAWITAFNCFDKNMVYSGGDDCKLKGWDLRTDPCLPVLTSTRHSMGVCSLQTSPCVQNILCSGSYDENVMIWDTRQMRRPLSEIGIGGGVWRVKWEPKHGHRILTASMHNGAHIIDTKDAHEGHPSVIGHHSKHSSMVYGADWCLLNNQSQSNTASADMSGEKRIITTCSFYDHALHLWEWGGENSIT